MSYKFQTEKEKEMFYYNLNKCLGIFKTKNPREQKETVKKTIKTFQLGVLNHRNGKEHFIKNLNFDYQLIYDYLNILYDEKLYLFEDEDLELFR